jgi:hypothetical protein
MCATYSLTAIPWPLSNSPNEGHLEYVLFVATDGMQTHKWSSTHTETFIEELRRIVPSGNAKEIYTRLLRGEPVLFPFLFDIEQITNKFRIVDNERLVNCM